VAKPSSKPKPSRSNAPKSSKSAASYTHPEQQAAMRPDVGTQDKFRKKKPAATYRYDSSLSPALDWDGQNGTRELGEWLLGLIKAAAALPAPHRFDTPQEFTGADGRVQVTVQSLQDAVDALTKLGKPLLTWAGKAERLSFDVPTLPLFVHERLSTKAIVETLVGHRKDKQQSLFDLFGDPQHSIADQVMRAYEHQDRWVNRMILGDSLVVMNSLLQYEGLGGQVQMIYIDPPYGVKFGSNFQPFVRKRDVAHNDDDDLTREPEMVKAYRDTWELGLHSYLTYMRDRLLLARDLLTPSGSVFVQISDENLHHVRELMDEVFGAGNFVSVVTFAKTTGATSSRLPTVSDFLIWYGKDKPSLKYRELFEPQPAIESASERYVCVETAAGDVIDLTVAQKLGKVPLPEGRVLRLRSTDSQGATPDSKNAVVFAGKPYYPPDGRHWSVTAAGVQKAVDAGRCYAVGKTLRWKSYHDEFPFRPVNNNWSDMSVSGFNDARLYVVQTLPAVIERCVLMTTDPGDLVLDPTCGAGTTAHVAEQWGRRWITIDTSRVPLALARQRLLTATFDYYELKDPARGPAGGFVYERRKNRSGLDVGGIVGHIKLETLAKELPPKEEILVHRPEKDTKIVRVSGPFCVEATIPTPVDWDGDGQDDTGAEAAQEYGSFVERMIEVLRRSPVLQVGGGKAVTVEGVRAPAKSLSLSAEGLVGEFAVAFVFGPENGAISEKLVNGALKEAGMKRYTHLYVVGFAIQPNARTLIESAEAVAGVPATYVQATPDLMMGDLLKNMRSSQIFSVCGLPEVKVHKAKAASADGAPRFQVELVGLDTFDPVTMKPDSRPGNDVPAWFLDTDYNELSFHVSQAFFPRTGAWGDLRKALKGDYDDSVWDHLAGTTSAPFEAGEHRQVAVKVIDDRGNELMVVAKLP